MIKRNQSSMTLLNNVTTNTDHSKTQFIQFQLRADNRSGADGNFIIVHIAVQLDLHAVNRLVFLLVLKSSCLLIAKYCQTKTSCLSKGINNNYLFYHLFDKNIRSAIFRLYE